MSVYLSDVCVRQVYVYVCARAPGVCVRARQGYVCVCVCDAGGRKLEKSRLLRRQLGMKEGRRNVFCL